MSIVLERAVEGYLLGDVSREGLEAVLYSVRRDRIRRVEVAMRESIAMRARFAQSVEIIGAGSG